MVFILTLLLVMIPRSAPLDQVTSSLRPPAATLASACAWSLPSKASRSIVAAGIIGQRGPDGFVLGISVNFIHMMLIYVDNLNSPDDI